MQEIAISPIKEEHEIQDLQALVKDIWREHFIPILGVDQVEYMLSNYQSEETIRKQIETGEQEYFFVRDQQGQTIGYVAYYIRQEMFFLSKLYLSKVVRGQGNASKVYRMLESFAITSACKKIRLHCNRHNVQALNVYDHFGFIIYDEQVTDIGSGYVMDDYVLEKSF